MDHSVKGDIGVALRPKRITLSDQVADSLIQLIMDGVYKPGQKLPVEQELCRQFEVSRTVIREAIRKLQIMNLLTVRQGHGTFVTNIDIGNYMDGLLPLISLGQPDWEQLFQARQVIEPGVVELCVDRQLETGALGHAEEDASPLWSHLEEMERALHRDNLKGYAEAENTFFRELARWSGNTVFESIVQSLSALTLRQRMQVSHVPRLAESSYHHHRDMLGAIVMGEKSRALENVHGYLELVGQVISGEKVLNRTEVMF